MLNFDALWIEKYRPRTLEDLCLDADVKSLIKTYADQKEIPNLLLVGRPGIGKTSLARIIINDLLQCQFLYINASDENGIDTVRHKITSFAQTKSLDGGIKIIVLDECLHEDTLVAVLADGVIKQIPIKDVDPCNHLVKTYNIVKDCIEYRPFTKADKGVRDVYEIELENGELITCTDNHKWYVKDVNGNVMRKKLIDIISENITEICTIDDGITALAHK